MSTVQAFLLGMMVAWTPSLIFLVWLLRDARLSDSHKFSDCQEQEPAHESGPSHRGEQSETDNKRWRKSAKARA